MDPVTMSIDGADPASAAQRWFLRPRRRPEPEMRLICLPHAGGGAAMFYRWADLLPPEIELLAVQLPGREARLREPPLLRMTTIVSRLATALTPLLDRPFAVFGHSMGAMIAFELARELRWREQPLPSRLFLSGRQAPNRHQAETPIHRLDDAALIREVTRRYGGVPAALLADSELLKMFLPAIRADFEVIETYRFVPEAPLACPFAIFAGRDDPQTRAENVAGWSALTSIGTVRRDFPGGHFYLSDVREAVVSAVVDDLRRAGKEVRSLGRNA